jgi:hypothetical protein
MPGNTLLSSLEIAIDTSEMAIDTSEMAQSWSEIAIAGCPRTKIRKSFLAGLAGFHTVNSLDFPRVPCNAV